MIQGTNLYAVSSVKFALVSAHFIQTSPTRIIARVPRRAGVGQVSVETPNDVALSSGNFKPLPSLNAFKPRRAVVGTKITITGSNLTAATSVRFHGRPAHFYVKSPTRIVATVPRAVTRGRIAVRTPAGKATTRHKFQPRRRWRHPHG